MKNRTIIGVICIALAVAVVFGVTPFISMLSSEKINVIQVNKFISEGSMITEEDIVTVEIGKHGTSADIITDAKNVVGKFASSDLYPSTNLLPSMLTADANNADAVFSTLDKDHVAMSITVPSFAAALSAKLENGDIVSIIVSEGDKTFIPAALNYVRVITTTTNEGLDRDKLDSAEEDAETMPATITLHVTPLQAKLLAEYELNGDMHMALVTRGDKEKAQEYLSIQDTILKELLEAEAGNEDPDLEVNGGGIDE